MLFAGNRLQVRIHHFGDQFRKSHRVLPSQHLARLGRISQKRIHFRRAKVPAIDSDHNVAGSRVDANLVDAFALPTDRAAHSGKGQFHKLAYAVGFPGRENIIARLRLLHDPPHPVHIIPGMTPVALGVKIPDIQRLLCAKMNAGHGARDFPRHKRFAAYRTLVVEQDPVRGMHSVGFAIVYGDPVGIQLGHAVWAPRIKRRGFLLRCLLRLSVQLRRRSLVEARLLGHAENPDRLQDS